MDAVIDGKFPDDLYYNSIFSKVISEKLSDGSIQDLYTCCSFSLVSDPVQNQTPQFVDLGFSTINALYEVSGISTPDTIVQIPMDGAHWSVFNHIFGEDKAVGVSEVRSD